MAAARMLSFGLTRALVGEASICASGSDRRAGARSAATVCQLSQRSPWGSVSLPRLGHGLAGADHECKVPASDSPRSSSPLQPSFYGEAAVVSPASEFVLEEAAVGRVECNSRGCRPCMAEPDSSWSRTRTTQDQDEAAAAVQQSSRMATYQNRSSARDRSLRGPKPHFPLDFAEYLNEVWMETAAADKYFAAALAANQHDAALLAEYAQFCWTSLSDADRAEGLFNQALEQAPDDSNILASYANFLWQTDQ